MYRIVAALGLLVASSAGSAQTPPIPEEFKKYLENVLQNTYKLNGVCKQLITPEGDQTSNCGSEILSITFPSGNSSFFAAIKDQGGVSFRGKDSKAQSDVAILQVSMILLTGPTPAPPIIIKAKGQCSYTNPNVGPVHVECLAKTAKGNYQLSYISDGVWPPK